MKRALLILLAATIASCAGDEVSAQYATIEDARRDYFVERGWLPDDVPTSLRDIRATNDLDTNISVGQFRFDPKEQLYFLMLVPACGESPPIPPAVSQEWAGLIGHGYHTFEDQANGTTWIFFCNLGEGACRYYMHPTAPDV